MRTFIAFIFVFLLYAVTMSAPSEDHWSLSPDEAADAFLSEAQTYILQEKYGLAVTVLNEAAEQDPNNADVWNLIGYSQRKRGNLAASAQAYEKALALNPDHIGALEYQGELFLLLGDVNSARRNLDRLTILCPNNCEEKTELYEAIRSHVDKN